MIRTLLVASSTLAILLVCFSIYQYSQGETRQRPSSRSPRLANPVGTTSPASSPETIPGVEVGGAKIGPGRNVRLSIYPREGAKALMQVSVRSWTPVADAANDFLLEDPEIRLRTNTGNAVRVVAHQGRLEALRRPGGNLEPTRGSLSGNVIIEFDRLTERQREQLPLEQREPKPADIVRCEFAEATFDVEYSRVTAPGPFTITASDASFSGSDLDVRFNEEQGRIDFLRVGSGGKLELRESDQIQFHDNTLPTHSRRESSLADWLRSTLQSKLPLAQTTVATGGPGAGARASAESAAKFASPIGPAPKNATQPETALVGAANASEAQLPEDWKGLPVFGSKSRIAANSAKPRPDQTYAARFEADVEAIRFIGAAADSSLAADSLEIIRRVTDSDRFSAANPKDGEPTANQGRSALLAPGGTLGNQAAKPSLERIVLTWSGRLVVEALGATEDRARMEGKSKIIARGTKDAPCRLLGSEGEARSAQAVFEPDRRRVELIGGDDAPVVIFAPGQGEIRSPRVITTLGIKEFSVDVLGPGHIVRPQKDKDAAILGPMPSTTSSASAAPLLASVAGVSFEGTLKLTGKYATERRFLRSGAIAEQDRRILERAWFEGRSRLHDDDSVLESNELEALFRPGPAGEMAAISSLRAAGDVVMGRADDRITADLVEVAFSADASSRVIPTQLIATGTVAAMQKDRSIRAKDRLIADFEVVTALRDSDRSAPVSNSGLQQSILRAREGGQVVAAPSNESSVRSRVGIRRMQAFGDVVVHDPAGNVNILADRLDCALAGGHELQTALLWGSAGRPTTAEMGAFSVVGDEIRIDAAAQMAEVPGAGRMHFQSRKDLDGRKLREPLPISITWSDSMRYDGQENRAVFTGKVHAASESSTTFDAERLAVEFEDAPPKEQPEKPEWWSLSRVADRFRGGKTEPAVFPNQASSKQPARMLATGDVRAVTSEASPNGEMKTRASIRGPRMSFNLRSDATRMLIEGEGSLLLEDFRAPAPSDQQAANAAASRPADGLLTFSSGSGPSKTLIRWGDAMWYDYALEQTRFEGAVDMTHLSGAELDRVFASDESRNAGSPDGRRTFLTCDALAVDFRSGAKGAAEERRMGRLSSDRLRQFQAQGNVTLRDEGAGLALSAETVGFEKDRTLLSILGSASRKARIVVNRPGEYPQDFSAERFFYNLSTKTVESLGQSYKGK